jgi:hypothetical protein
MRIHRMGAAAAAAALLAAAAPAGAQSLNGTVVHHNGRAHSFVVATGNGRLAAVHAASLPGVGRSVRLQARALRNGTFAGSHVHAGRRHRHVHLHGTVSFADRHRHRFVLSADGVSLLVRARSADVPAAGQTVDVQATLPASAMPVAHAVTPTGTDFTIHLEGNVVAVDTTARTIAITADDDDQAGAQLTIAVPDATIDLTKLTAGQEVELLVALHSDGTFTLLGFADDENGQQADDQGDESGQPCGGQHEGDQGEHEDQGGEGDHGDHEGDHGDGGD